MDQALSQVLGHAGARKDCMQQHIADIPATGRDGNVDLKSKTRRL